MPALPKLSRVATIKRATACFIVALCAGLQAGPKPLANPPANAMAGTTNASFKQVGPGLFELGHVKLNAHQKEISFPAVVNQQQGVVEYLLVSTQGKVHESLLRTEAEPYHINLGLLLLNAKAAPKGSLAEDYSKPVPGDPIQVSVTFHLGVAEKTMPAAKLVIDQSAKGPLQTEHWTFSGSRVIDGTYLAQRDRSLIALIGDIDAVVNNPKMVGKTDDNWIVNTNVCPAVGTPATVVFKVEKKKD